MQHVLAMDVAERHSAAILLDETGRVVYEASVDVGSSKTEDWNLRLANLVKWWNGIRDELPENVLVRVEDIHPFAINPKPALRLQGALMLLIIGSGRKFQFVTANEWQRHFGYKKQKGRSSDGWAKEKCIELGYKLPKWAKGKQLQDLRDAFLIGKYVLEKEVRK